jgi:hypothetical protein
MCAAPLQALILDEAHRLKSRTSATCAALLELPVHWWLLLSGTPVQNNMRELQVGTPIQQVHCGPPSPAVRCLYSCGQQRKQVASDTA